MNTDFPRLQHNDSASNAVAATGQIRTVLAAPRSGAAHVHAAVRLGLVQVDVLASN